MQVFASNSLERCPMRLPKTSTLPLLKCMEENLKSAFLCSNIFFSPNVLSSSSIWSNFEFWIFVLIFSTALACRKTTTNIQYSKFKVWNVQIDELPRTLDFNKLTLDTILQARRKMQKFGGATIFFPNVWIWRVWGAISVSLSKNSINSEKYR